MRLHQICHTLITAYRWPVPVPVVSRHSRACVVTQTAGQTRRGADARVRAEHSRSLVRRSHAPQTSAQQPGSTELPFRDALREAAVALSQICNAIKWTNMGRIVVRVRRFYDGLIG